MTTTTALVDLPRTILGSLTTTFTAPTSCAFLGVAYVGYDLVGWKGQVRIIHISLQNLLLLLSPPTVATQVE